MPRPRGASLLARILAMLLALMAFGSGTARAELADITVRVAQGDTARRIARRHGLSLEALEALNGNTSLDRIRVGQTLVVGRAHLHLHRVRRGDTLPNIAARYRVDRRSIQTWNQLRGQRLREGTELRIYSNRETPPSESIGRPDQGSLVHGLRVPPHPGFVVRHAARTYMTDDAIEKLLQAFDALRDADPEAPRVEVGDASRSTGGRLDQHRSHQSGRDVDIGYFLRRCQGTCAHRRLRAADLDATRQWRLIQAWLRADAVEYIFIDHALQEPLYQAAREAGATRAQLQAWFQWPRAEDVRMGIIRHVPRHADHLHVRFRCAESDRQCVATGGSLRDADD